MREIKLSPCPFCSGKVEIRQKGHSSYYGGCVNGCFISSSEYDKNVLAKQLNTRKPMQEIVEKLEEEIVTSVPEDKLETRAKYWNEGLGRAKVIVKEVGGMNG